MSIVDSNIEIYNETVMYTVAVMAALTYPSQCLPEELLQAKIQVGWIGESDTLTMPVVGRQCSGAEVAGSKLYSVS